MATTIEHGGQTVKISRGTEAPIFVVVSNEAHMLELELTVSVAKLIGQALLQTADEVRHDDSRVAKGQLVDVTG